MQHTRTRGKNKNYKSEKFGIEQQKDRNTNIYITDLHRVKANLCIRNSLRRRLCLNLNLFGDRVVHIITGGCSRNTS